MSKQHQADEKNKVLAKQRDADKDKPQKGQAAPPSLQQGLDASTITHLQKTVGNNAVQAMLAQRKESAGPSPLQDDVADNIRSEKGGGHQLHPDVADKAGGVMGQDFSDVNVHTDGKADNLSRSIGAKAFTTGNDIFFKEGEYNPQSEEGQHLISHELTHVVQQGSGNKAPSSVQGKMTVNDPNDKYEKEADNVADKVVKSEAAPVQAQESEGQAQRAEEEEEVAAKRDDTVQREEEEEVAAKRDNTVQREEEEEVAAKRDNTVQREEEEEVAAKRDNTVQREEEEEVAAKRDDAVQREEEEEVAAKLDNTVQREEEEEVAAKRDDAVQREEEEEVAAKSEVQRQETEDEEPA